MAIRRGLRVLFGLLLIAHGVSHAVLPLRGSGAPLFPDTDWTPMILYCVAMIGFVTAGLGVLGVRPMDRMISESMILASIYSLVGMLRLGHSDLWLGAAFDIVLVPVAVWRGYTGWFPRSSVGGARAMLATAGGVLLLGYVITGAVTWPHHHAWGSTVEERQMSLPGDDATRDPRFEIQHTVTIDAPPEAVWSWLLQLGQDRAGFYSYDWLERLFGADVHNAVEIRPEWQHREAGDFVRATQATYMRGWLGTNLGWTITALEPGRAMVLEHWGAFVLVPQADGDTRLVVRSTVSRPDIPVWAAALQFTFFELPHFIMERRMLLRIKGLAEAQAAQSRAASLGTY